jgi:hypothetical protein
VVFIHEGVFHPSDALNIQNHQSQHDMIEAKRIFDLCYRADKNTSFVITDHKSLSHMNGCHGKIVCYDCLRQQYNVLITSNNAKQSEGNITALSPGVMGSTYVFRERQNSSCYQLSRRDSKISTTKVIQLELPKPSCAEPISTLQDNEVKCCFFYDIFELARQVHIHPEQVANGSLKALLLKELEKAENEHVAEPAKISIARQDFVRSYKRMASTHLNRKIDGPK